ncbi:MULTISPECIES: dihydrodipicolinate synthase family protein [Pseudomonas]|uniref:dihydrodipicolinate synthase family protein n=1 Tax=Pseudomonas TaxID=286 RepID=UPI001F001E87|nr:MULTISPECIES: dihydrodipicolinate synthase family protein [Pseudomonas]MCG8296029.1 dihydrodipicolinate synthase family protein [Pseudomonas entomophila]
MTQLPIQGVLPVAILPYNNDLSLDTSALRLQVEHILHTGCDGVVIGQISEVSRLTTSERFRVAELIAEQTGDKGLAIMSTGGESIAQAIEYSRQAEQAGCDALLVMHPSMWALDDEQMYTYFANVVESVQIPVLVHHAKSLAKRPLSIDVQARLLKAFGPQKVQFKPESAPTAPKVSLLRDATGGQARIFEGDGGMMLVDTYQRGLAGVIPATEIAEITVALWRALQAGDERTARAIAYPLSYLMCHMMASIDCYLQLSKHLLKRRRLMSNTLIRPPVDFTMDVETLKEVEKVYDQLFEFVTQ